MSNVPKLRFKEFSEEWESKKVKQLLKEKINNGETITKDDFDINGVVKIVQLNDLFGANITINTKSLATISIDRKVKNIMDNDLMINRVSIKPSGVGKAVLVDNLNEDELITFESNMFCIRLNKQINELFFVYYSNTERYIKQKLSLAKVTNQASLSQSDIGFVNVVFPSIQEQEKIASFLTSVDTKIEQLTKKEELLQQYKKGVMQKIFSQEIRFKKDDGSEFEEWEESTIGKNISNIGGTALEKFVSESSTYKFISIGNYSINGRYIDNGQRVDFNEKTKTKLLNKNDLVMVLNDKTSSGDIIGSSILIDEDNQYIYNQRSERIICNDTVLPLYLWHYFNSRYFRKKVFSLAQGGTQIYINFSSIKSMNIKLPCIKEQNKIANFLSSIDSKIVQVQKQLKQTKEFKKALLQQMFV